MALPKFFTTTEQVIDLTQPELPLVKLMVANKTAFGGSSFKNHLVSEQIGGTSIISSVVGAENSVVYNTTTSIVPSMALLHNSHGNVVTPDFGAAITSSDQPFNFAGIALSTAPQSFGVWVKKNPTTSPSSRSYFDLAYMDDYQKVVLFGGVNSSLKLNDTWEWNGLEWLERETEDSPSARKEFAIVGATFSNVNSIFLFGGLNASNSSVDDTWKYTGTNWVQLSPATSPSARSIHAMAFDRNNEKIVMFGGYSDGYFHFDTWEYDGTTWAQVFPVNNPAGRAGHCMAYDSVRNKIVLFGGSTGSLNFFGDTWEYDGVNWVEVKIPGVLPPPRSEARLVFDESEKAVILFGGIAETGFELSDMWKYDGVAWIEITSTGPQPRASFGMTYDSSRDRIVLFGGIDHADREYGDTWEIVRQQHPVTVQTTGDGYVYYDASNGRPTPVVGDFLGPSSAYGTVTPIYDGYSPVFGIAIEGPVINPNDAPNPLLQTVNGFTVGMIKMRIRPFYGFIPPTSPTITNFYPSAAVVGSTVTIDGTVFVGTTEVVVDGYNASFSVISNNQLTFVVPAGAQQGAITVVNSQGNSTSLTDFSTLPKIISVGPSSGAEGDAVTITGYTLNYATSITFNGVNQPSFTVVSDSEITTTIPAGGTSGVIEITITYPSTDQYTATYDNFGVVEPPVITNIAPITGPVGSAAFTLLNGGINDSVTTITVDSTTGFLATGTLYIDAEQISYTGVTATTFTGCTRGINGTIAASHTDDAPVNSGNVNPAGYVSILGSGFLTAGSAADGYGVVQFVPVTTGSTLTARRIIFNNTTISVVVPNPGIPQPSKNYYIRITTNGGIATSSQEFTIIPIPKFLDAPGPTFLSQTDDAYGTAGDVVRIFGDYGFTGLSRVLFDGYSSPSIKFINDGYITAVVPTVSSVEDVTGPISVTSTGGTKSTADTPTTNPVNFTILQTPAITSISPTSGKTGDTVTILGTNLLAVSSVKFDGMSSTAVFSIVNSGKITVTVPAESSGITQSPSTGVITIHKGSFDAYSAQSFQYYPPPTISNYLPEAVNGVNAGYGTVVSISGTNLNQGGVPTITVGGVTATISTSSSISTTFTVPSGANNGVTLTTAGGSAIISPFVILKPVTITSFYTDWPYDHHAATDWYPSIIDVYGTNFTSSMYVYVTCPSLGGASRVVTYTFFSSTQFRFTAANLGDFSGRSCNINVITYFPGGSYSTFTTGLFIFSVVP